MIQMFVLTLSSEAFSSVAFRLCYFVRARSQKSVWYFIVIISVPACVSQDRLDFWFYCTHCLSIDCFSRVMAPTNQTPAMLLTIDPVARPQRRGHDMR